MDYKDMERARRTREMRMSHAERLLACEAMRRNSLSLMSIRAKEEFSKAQRQRRIYKEENGRLAYAGSDKWIESVCAIPPEERR
jgi:hypothetical protein